MLELKRIGDRVFCGEVELHINPQATKNGGKGYPVVSIEKFVRPDQKKWLALNKLVEGLNVFNDNDLVGREPTKQYELTEEEEKEIAEHQARIDEIIATAKARYVKPIKVKTVKDLTKMSKSELEAEIERLNKILEEKKGE
jgi:hypothetical protein